eukprot:TRINITY_DN8804_c0_g1_i1.p1 TRINITY_DN8804_c0_g1~~TRINITY_DN8804_c0_g1_i1.p1  ORF type:complete len:759 (+),score=296.79 TRINITY_DN8804_c0_g1_i1:76-2352(+)
MASGSAATEYQVFQQERFDPRKWINDALRSAKPGELEQQVNQLQMQLQLFSTSVNGTFEDQVMQLLARFPTCMLTLDKISRETAHLSQSLAALLTPEVLERQGKAEQSIRALQDLHDTKGKLEVIQQTLSQTVYLRDNRHLIDDAFKRGAIDEAAAEIGRMRKALADIKGFPHHDRLAADIAKYEARMQGEVEKECVECLAQRNTDRAQKLLQTLRQIGRFNDVVESYIGKVTEPVLAKWKAGMARIPEGAGGGKALVEFLPGWHDELQELLSDHKKYYHQVFAQEADGVLLQCLQSVLGAVQAQQRQRLEALPVQEVVAAYKASRQLRQHARAELLKSPTAEALAVVDAAVAAPYAALQRQHATLEKRHLRQLISRFGFVEQLEGVGTLTISPSLVAGVAESGGELLLAFQKAVERCADFTDGAAFPALAAVLDESASEFCAKVTTLVAQLRGALGLDAPPPPPQRAGPPRGSPGAAGGAEAAPAAPPPVRHGPFAADEPFKVKLGLQLHAAAAALSQRLRLFDCEARRKMADALSESPSVARTPAVAAFAVRLTAEGESLALFGGAAGELSKLSEAAQTLVFDILFDAVDARLAQMHRLPIWQEGTTGLDMPQLDGSPQEYIRLTGDYVLGLSDVISQGLPEAASGAGQAVDGESRGEYWMDLVVKRTVDLFVTGVTKIPRLHPQGATQLACDAEYLDNVVDAFQDGGAPVLKVIEQLCASEAESYAEQLADLADTDPRAPALFRAIATKRGIDVG